MYPMMNPHLGGNITAGIGPNMGTNIGPGANMTNNPGYMMMAGMGGPLMMDPNMLAMGQFAIPPGMSSVPLPPQAIPVTAEQNVCPPAQYKGEHFFYIMFERILFLYFILHNIS